MSEKVYLQTKKLCVGYQKHIVVDNIEISLEQGEILTLIGPNGAGKSTVLKSIARQLETLAEVFISIRKNCQGCLDNSCHRAWQS